MLFSKSTHFCGFLFSFILIFFLGRDLHFSNLNGSQISIGNLKKSININAFPRIGSEEDDVLRFERALLALPEGGNLRLNPNETYVFNKEVRGWKNSMTLEGSGWTTVIETKAPVCGIRIKNKVGIILKNFKLKGYGVSGFSNNTSIILDSSTNCQLLNLRADSFAAQGIVLGGTSKHNSLKGITVTNCQDANRGCGVLLYGGEVSENYITDITASWCRIGVSLNFAHRNKIGRVVANDCSSIGFTLDGIGPGEGATYNIIENVVALRNGYKVNFYGGIYCGNYSEYNKFNKVVCNNNYSSGVHNRANNNIYQSIVCNENGWWGFRNRGNGNLIGTKRVICNNNQKNGIHLEEGMKNQVGNKRSENQANYNKGNGIYISASSDSNRIERIQLIGNLLEGLKLAEGRRGNIFD